METRHYDLAAGLYLKLNSLGETAVNVYLNRELQDCRKRVFQFVSDENSLEVYYRRAENLTDKEPADFGDKELNAAFEYLTAVDFLTALTENEVLDVLGTDSPLNSKHRDKIEIYRTYRGIDRASSSYDNIACAFFNLMIFFKANELHSRIKLRNYYISETKDKLRIGFAPYKACASENKVTKTVGGDIIWEEREEFSDDDDKCLKSYEYLSGEKGCDVVFGPEMHGSRRLDGRLKSVAREIICLTCPSFHRREGDEVKNQSTFYINQENHRRTVTADKIVPASLRGTAEGLSPGPLKADSNIVILHIKGIGRVMFLICKDFITKDLNELIHKLNIDAVIVQSYTESLSAFRQYANDTMPKRVVILGNSCNASKKVKKGEGTNVHPLICYNYNYNRGADGDAQCVTESECPLHCEYSLSCCRVVEIKIKSVTVEGNERQMLDAVIEAA